MQAPVVERIEVAFAVAEHQAQQRIRLVAHSAGELSINPGQLDSAAMNGLQIDGPGPCGRMVPYDGPTVVAAGQFVQVGASATKTEVNCGQIEAGDVEILVTVRGGFAFGALVIGWQGTDHLVVG